MLNPLLTRRWRPPLTLSLGPAIAFATWRPSISKEMTRSLRPSIASTMADIPSPFMLRSKAVSMKPCSLLKGVMASGSFSPPIMAFPPLNPNRVGAFMMPPFAYHSIPKWGTLGGVSEKLPVIEM